MLHAIKSVFKYSLASMLLAESARADAALFDFTNNTGFVQETRMSTVIVPEPNAYALMVSILALTVVLYHCRG